MWPWIKHWRDWAMHNLWPLHRIGPQPQALHYSYEKAGLTLHDQPIPWNAEAVVVEALLRLPIPTSRRKTDFLLRFPDQEPIAADTLRRQEIDDRYRLSFRIATPPTTTVAEVMWRTHVLGQLTLPVLGREEFLQGLRLEMPTVFVRLGDESVACQTFVSSQCKGLMANAVLTHPTNSLVPLLDLDLQVAFRCERTGSAHSVPARLSSTQLAGRKALIAVVPRRFPRRIGTWLATWMLGDRGLASVRVRAISQRHFQRSLRISDTRFVIQPIKDQVRVARQVPPLEEIARLGPCFLVSSSEPGMAGLCALSVRAQVSGAIQPPLLQEQEVLITDGPSMVAPGTMDVADLAQVNAFELCLKGKPLGAVSLCPAPTAAFTAEGGFKPVPEFSWSAAADEELNDRLARLLEGRS